MRNYDRTIERLFRYVEMLIVTGIINLALRSTLETVWAFLLTLPFGALALTYLIGPSLRQHEKVLRKVDSDLIGVGGFILLMATLWLADRISQVAIS